METSVPHGCPNGEPPRTTTFERSLEIWRQRSGPRPVTCASALRWLDSPDAARRSDRRGE